MTFQMRIERSAWALDLLRMLQMRYAIGFHEEIVIDTKSQVAEDVLKLVFPNGKTDKQGGNGSTPTAAPAQPAPGDSEDPFIVTTHNPFQKIVDAERKKVEPKAVRVRGPVGRPRKVRADKVCPECGKVFRPVKDRLMFCSKPCAELANVRKARAKRLVKSAPPIPGAEIGVSYMPESEQGLVFKALMAEAQGVGNG